MKQFIKKLKTYIDTHHPVIYLESLYELEVDDIILELSKKTKSSIMEYSHGRVSVYTDTGSKKYLDSISLADFLDKRLKDDFPKRFIVIKDIHKHLSESPSNEATDVLFRLKNLIYKIVKSDGASETTIFIVAPTLSIPVEISQFVTVFTVMPPSDEEIMGIINGFESKHSAGVDSIIDEDFKKEIVSRLKGLSRYEIKKILALALANDGHINKDDIQLIASEKGQMVKKSAILEMIEVKAKPDSLAGLQNLKAWIGKKSKIFERLAEAKTKKIDPPKGVMLVGLPGCGKSLSAEVIAAIMKTPLLRLDMGKLLGKYVGESEENMRRAIHLAEAVSPCVLWIDEIEKAFVGVSGDSGGSDVSKRMFGSFLTWMQEKTSPVFVVATANDITSLPPELLRKGRFDELFSVALPNKDEREGIFAVHLKKRDADSNIDKKRLAELSEGFIGAEIESVVKDALEEAFIDQKQFNTALLERITKELKPMSKSQKAKIDSYNQKIKELDIKSAS